ncbi:MAG: hypothetical protein BIFFINMI_03797 [Phycisphaerae bacterium]|nr:hypothetical protein [Phycisphaerae bacterium]
MNHQHVNHGLHHPDVHYASGPWSETATLHVASAYINPQRWERRRRLFNDFRRHMAASPNVKLYVGELAYGDRPFEVTHEGHADDVQLRTSAQLWHKENVLNLVISRFPSDWEYGAYVDGDFHMTRRDWALEAIHLLQHYDFVQLFSSYSDLTNDHRPMSVVPSFAYNWIERMGRPPSGYRGGSPGGAWAFRRSAFETVGSLLDTCILGSGDWYMAAGLAGFADHRPETEGCRAEYRRAIHVWQKRAAGMKGNIGYLPNHAIHYFHGSKSRRGYGSRWTILRDHAFDPHTDLFRDWQGVYQLTPDKPGLRDAIRRYFASRNEDDPSLREGERVLI